MSLDLVLASGGINSTVVAARVKREGDLHLLFADFGQRAANAQLEAIKLIARRLGAPLTTIELGHVALIDAIGRSAEAEPDAAQTGSRPSPLSQVVGLKSVLLSASLQLAHRIGAQSVQTGDSEAANEQETESAPGQGTPDHRREFMYLSGLLFEQLQPGKVRVELKTPLIDLTRDQIIKLGQRFDAPLELTISCKSQRSARCGSCPSCVARTRAFKAAGIADPTMATAG